MLERDYKLDMATNARRESVKKCSGVWLFSFHISLRLLGHNIVTKLSLFHTARLFSKDFNTFAVCLSQG